MRTGYRNRLVIHMSEINNKRGPKHAMYPTQKIKNRYNFIFYFYFFPCFFKLEVTNLKAKRMPTKTNNKFEKCAVIS